MKLLSPEDAAIFKKIDLRQPYVWLATWFGFGFFRPAPGTWGSVGSIPPALIVFSFAGIKGLTAGIFIITALGLWASKHFDHATGGHDNKMIVIDEAAGQWIALAPALYLIGISPIPVLIAFILFRFFDILKPWPISWADKKLSGALSVMLDDILAGLAAAIIITGLILYAGLG